MSDKEKKHKSKCRKAFRVISFVALTIGSMMTAPLMINWGAEKINKLMWDRSKNDAEYEYDPEIVRKVKGENGND